MSINIFNTLKIRTTITVILTGIFLLLSYATSESFFLSICDKQPFCTPINLAALSFFVHRVFALVVMIWLVVNLHFVWKHYRTNHLLLNQASILLILYVFQVLIGLEMVMDSASTDFRMLHKITTLTIILDLVYFAITSKKAFGQKMDYPELNLRERFMDVIQLTKPIIVLLLLLTTLAGMFFGAKAVPESRTIILTLLGGALAAGGSGAINQFLDRDLDSEMQRTSKRPVPSGRIYPSEALAIGISFCLVSIYIFLIYINPISAALTLLGIIYYVYFYSILLKKATVQNIVIGGGAGALPSVIGWTAVTGQISVQAFLLFLIVFLWTPPHFWALAIVRKNDYAKVKIPMLPVIMGEAFTRRSIFNYSIILVLSTLLLPLFQYTGSVFLLSSVLLGVGFIFLAWRVVKVEGNKVAWTLYKYSSYYLFFIFIALIVDSLIA